MTEEKFLKLYGKVGELYSEFAQNLKADSYERNKILDKITECGMWFKMYYDLEKSPEVLAAIGVKPKPEKGNA